MKILLAILLFATCAFGQGMGPGPGVKGYAGGGGCSPGIDIGNGWCEIAHAVAGSADTTSAVTSPGITTTGADLIVVVVSCYTGAGSLVATDVSDSKSNSWTEGRIKDEGGTETMLVFSKPTTVGSGHTFTVSNALVTYPTITVYAVSGSHASPFDQANGGTTGGSATTVAPNSITPTQNDELVISGWALQPAIGGTPTASGMTVSDFLTNNGSTNISGALAYVTQSTATAINPTWAWTTSGAATAVIVSFKHS